MKKRFVILVLAASFALFSQAATVEYWSFENTSFGGSSPNGPSPTNDMWFTDTSIGSEPGAYGSYGAYGTLGRGWDQTSGPQFDSDDLSGPYAGGFAMDTVDKSGDMYVTAGRLDDWTSPDWTLEMHFKADAWEDNGWTTLVGRDGSSWGSAESDFYFQRKGMGNNELRLNYRDVDGTQHILDGTRTLSLNQWYGLAVVADSSAGTLTMYIDDGSGYSMEAQTTGFSEDLGITSSFLSWTFGRGWYNGGLVDNADAHFDNIRFSDNALSVNELIPLNTAGSQLVVTTADDSGGGSLRQTIADAFSGDVVTFTNTLSGQTIVLTTGQLSVNKYLTIDASALTNGIAIDGNGTSRIFEFSSGTGNTLIGLTLTNGYAEGSFAPTNCGGAIYLAGGAALTVSNCTLTGNSIGYNGNGGGIFAFNCNLTLNNSILSGNTNSGIFNNNGTVILNGSTVSSSDGVGIYNYSGTIQVENSTVSDNAGRGIYNTETGRAAVNNSTLSGNGGGIYNKNGGQFIVNSSTISGNSARTGGGIFNQMSLFWITNSIVAGNTAVSGTNIYSDVTVYNSGCLLSGDPVLAPLGDYGGFTQTMPPRLGSPAIDAGTNTVSLPATDQRGYPRLIGKSLDIGACEECFITNSYVSGSEIVLEWMPVPMWESTVMYSTNLTTMPFAELTNGLVYPVHSFTDVVHAAENQCFYKIEIAP